MLKMIKKMISVVLVSALTLMCTVTAFAAEQKLATEESQKDSCYILVEVNDPITDTQLLMERGLMHQNDASSELVEVIEKNCVLTIDNVIQKDKPLVTTQLISVAENVYNSNDRICTYLATVISNMDYVNGTLRSTNYTKEEDVNSSGGEITLYTTVAYETGTVGGVGYIKVKSASARARANVGMLSISYVKARYMYTGINYDTRRLENVTSTWKTSYSTSVTNTATSAARLECVDGGIFWEVGAEGLAHVTRGGSSWDTRHSVYENGMGLP